MGPEQICRRGRGPSRHCFISGKRIAHLLDLTGQSQYRFAVDHCRDLIQAQGVVLDSQGCLDGADPVFPAQHGDLRALRRAPLPHQFCDLRHPAQHGVGQGEGRGIGCHGGLRLKRLQMRRLRDYQIGGKTNTAAYLCEFCDKRYAMTYDMEPFVAN